jgi:uncharacterized protein (TIGR00251 family)
MSQEKDLKYYSLADFRKQFKAKGEIYLKIKARPGASLSAVKEIMEDGAVKIDIAAPAVKGKANQELVKFLAKEFGVLKNNIKVISGAGERIKLVHIVYNL